jgi:hypothetical protein
MRRPQAGAEARERDDYIQTLMNFRRAKQAGALAL